MKAGSDGVHFDGIWGLYIPFSYGFLPGNRETRLHITIMTRTLPFNLEPQLSDSINPLSFPPSVKSSVSAVPDTPTLSIGRPLRVQIILVLNPW